VAARTLPPYGWPLKPFDRMHPVRGYFNDPRISGKSRAFHFGIDVSGPDGKPVYAVEAGQVHLEGTQSLSVVGEGGARTFGYWHVDPVVRHHQVVRQHQLLGHIAAGWGHVHFAETHGLRKYVNPLRPGALSPWRDATSPRIAGIHFYRGRRELSPLDVGGVADVVVEAYDLPPVPVPPPWSNLPVTPARLRWRVLHGRRVVRAWHTPVDFSRSLLPANLFPIVYAPGTRQNHPGEAGSYRFFVAHSWTTSLLPNGLYRIEVEASDMSGNRAVAGLPFTISN
jgi:hypothetical protein